jgi:hypothetical protein
MIRLYSALATSGLATAVYFFVAYFYKLVFEFFDIYCRDILQTYFVILAEWLFP